MRHVLKLRPVLFLLILGAGLVPLLISTGVLLKPNRDLLRTQEQTDLTRTAEALSREVDLYLRETRRELELLGSALAAAPGPLSATERLQEPWVASFLQSFVAAHPDLKSFAAFDTSGEGLRFTGQGGDALPDAEIRAAFSQALAARSPSYGFAAVGSSKRPAVVLAVPFQLSPPERIFVLQVVVQPNRLLRDLAAPELAAAGGETFLIDRQGALIWASGTSVERQRALLASDLVRSFVARPMPLTEIYDVASSGEERRVIAIVSPIAETGWGVVAHRPESSAFLSARRLLFTALISTLFLVLLAFVIAYLASTWIGQPIQRLALASHEIAGGNFSSRVDTEGLRFELADLARDFNLMGGYVQGYVEQLQRAAHANRELFIGSLRALTAAIDAKDPYTRGHSERVASVSRTISRHMGMTEDFQSRLWIAALLHDVGKIGVDDRILKKGGVLSPEEYAMMQRHTVIGAEIMAPIEQLREALPVIRGHHENWNGKGYPDGLKGEKIPLMARIVAVADSFDAITTTRPYQNAYTFEYAVETIKKLTGSRFDAKVVTAFLKAVEKKEITVRREAAAPAAANEALASSAAGGA